ncbi:hypothetical protein [Nannocystis pusilla]|uniref:hypothetical protein n=1 Tax=Nannocystis pusilla TaxID=889268 RepID=UPI003B76B733
MPADLRRLVRRRRGLLLPAPNTPGCKKIESFDAGALTFLGTPIPITLFPPYAFMSDDNASPFAPGGTATVQASGASNAGFAAFEKEFTGTQFIQTSPKLDALDFAEVFGDGPLPVRWNAGDGEVTITATVTSSNFAVGTITCKADDPSGKFDIRARRSRRRSTATRRSTSPCRCSASASTCTRT